MAPTVTVTRNAAPQVDRSSVAGVAEGLLPSVVDITTGQDEGSGVIMTADRLKVSYAEVVGLVSPVTTTLLDPALKKGRWILVSFYANAKSHGRPHSAHAGS